MSSPSTAAMAGGAPSDELAGFLQDVIGRDTSLTPTSGRLREIHARIAREVDDAKVRTPSAASWRELRGLTLLAACTQKELHQTVQKQWPTLQRQYRRTIDLSSRLKYVQSSVKELEEELDGSVCCTHRIYVASTMGLTCTNDCRTPPSYHDFNAISHHTRTSVHGMHNLPPSLSFWIACILFNQP